MKSLHLLLLTLFMSCTIEESNVHRIARVFHPESIIVGKVVVYPQNHIVEHVDLKIVDEKSSSMKVYTLDHDELIFVTHTTNEYYSALHWYISEAVTPRGYTLP